jgi:pilus assembly protein CpaC
MTNTIPVEMFAVLCGASTTVVAAASRMRKAFTKMLGFVVLLAAVMTVATIARGQEMSYNASFAKTKEPIAINVLVGQSRLITFDHSLERFSVSNPEIAEAVLVSGNQVVVNGKAFGQINLIAWEKSSTRFIIFDVYVRTNLSLIDSQIRALFPKDDIRLSQANGSVVLSGTVHDSTVAAQADAVIQAAGFKTVNMLASPVQDLVQVQLQVRVAEVNRKRMRDLGTGYAYQSQPGAGGFIGTGGSPYSVGAIDSGRILGSVAGSALNVFLMGGNTFMFLKALQEQGALRALAEPNLIAMNGQTASFLAGGEFPVPVIQSSGGGGNNSPVTIIFKEYGVRLNFKPTILDEDHIRLELEPEVSTLDFANGVRFNGFTIPALRTRRAKTGVELRDGQSFALAGLLDNNETQSFSKVPGLGDVPILGNLFKSKSFQKNESELMFIVTAQVVHPVNRDDVPALPAVESMKKGSLLGVAPAIATPVKTSDNGQTGYITEPNKPSADNGQNGYITDPAKPPVTPVVPSTKPASNGPDSKTDAPKTQSSTDGAPVAKANPEKP